VDILAKIQCLHTDDPNARVDSFSSPPSIEFFNAKISNAEKGFIGFLAMFAQDLT
jgi:hypothetical protein